jgi:hypothetical protein
MKLKTVEVNGKQYAEVDAGGLPVYVHEDGQEMALMLFRPLERFLR